MRAPIAAGFLAGLLVGVAVIGAGLMTILSSPAEPPVAIAPTTAPPAATASPTASPTPESPAPGATPDGTPPASETPVASGSVGLDVGQPAPPLRVAQLGGGEIDTTQLRGQPLWINFMATWCPSCREELPLMERFQAELGESMTILVVDVGEDVDTVASYMAELGVDLPVGVDPSGAAEADWAAWVLPMHYWIDADGRIAGFVYGPAGPEPFADGVRQVLPDFELEP